MIFKGYFQEVLFLKTTFLYNNYWC